MNTKNAIRLTMAGIGVVLIAAACDQGTTSPRVDGTTLVAGGLASAVGDVIPKPAATDLGELYVICKTGPSATFNISAGSLSGSAFTVNDGECRVAYEGGGTTMTLSSSENVPAGVQLDSVKLTQLTCGLGVGTDCDSGSYPDISGPTKVFTGPLAGAATSTSFSGFVGGTGPTGSRTQKGLSGVLVEYFDSLIPVTGGEGCTPGFWKNRGYRLGWPSPYSPTDSYDTTFGVTSSFGGTLLEALNGRGGGEVALGRHAVAALLNAASSSVDYDLTVAEVIAAVQSAYTSGDFESVKDDLAVYNELEAPGFCD